MQKLIFATALISAVYILSSCNSQDDINQIEDDAPAVFFPLADFIDTEVARLDSLNLTLAKKVNYQGKEEEQTVETIDFEQELSIFRRADINKPSWTDKYQADSVFQDAQVREASYQALEEDLEVRSLLVKWDAGGAVTEVRIRRENSSALASNEYDLAYFPATGYRISTQQQNRAAEPIAITIEGNFIAKE
ncbi:MAG: hypothetical protein AAFP77_27685 [Bacteroidota bacterium]